VVLVGGVGEEAHTTFFFFFFFFLFLMMFSVSYGKK